MKKIISNKTLFYILGIVFLFALWFLISFLVDVDSMIFPNPFVTIKRMVELLGQKYTYKCLLFSITRLVIGFIVSFIVAFLIGMIVNTNENLYNFFNPLITFFKSAPTATFVFLFIILTGAKNAPVFVVFTVTMPILYESVVGAFRSTRKEILAAAQIDGANKVKTMLKIQIPLGLQFISVGIISTFALAFKIEIMAEIITGYTRGGLGSLMHNSQVSNPTDLTDTFAYSLMAIILVLVITFIASILKQKRTPVRKHRSGYGI